MFHIGQFLVYTVETAEDFYVFKYINKLQIATIYSLITSFITHVLMMRVVVNLYNQRIQLWRYLAAGLVSATAYVLPVYVAECFYNPFVFSVKLSQVLTICPPYFIFIYYFVIVHILKINPYRCPHIVSKLYYMALASVLSFYVILASSCGMLRFSLPDEGFVLFFVNVLSIVIAWVVTSSLIRHIKKHSLWFENFIQQVDTNVFKRLIIFILQDTGVYLLIVVIVQIARQDTTDLLTADTAFALCIGLCVLFFIYRYSSDRIINNKIALENKDLYIASLVESIHKFRMVKHDINNMMQVYNGYFALENYTALKKYHDSIYKMTADVNDNMELNEIKQQNYGLYSVLDAKMQRASEKNLTLRISCTADTSCISIRPPELPRMLAILLDNAIEETAQTGKSIIHFSLEPKMNRVLISITNPTVGIVDVKQIRLKGFTTKQRHRGLGLNELWNMITSTSDCSLDVEYFNHSITFYLEVPCITDETHMR